MKGKSFTKDERMLLWLLLPSLIGFLAFYIIPFVLSLYLALIDNSVNRAFIGLRNFQEVLTNQAFRLAIKNTVLFLAVYLPVNIILPLLMAVLINKTGKKLGTFFTVIFMLPIVIPTGSMVFFWKSIFGINGIINGFFFFNSPVDWFNSDYARLIIILIFTWKNAGYNMVLFLAGLNYIPKDFYEFASIEGANSIQSFFKITIPCILPSAILVLIMSIINSFNSFKEVYLISGSYPHQSIYMLQHYMNNQFAALNYQKLASASYILSLLFIFISFMLLRYQNEMAKSA